LDPNRLTLAYFCTAGLELLGVLTPEEKARCVEWVYGLQLPASESGETRPGGFRGGPFFGGPFDSESVPVPDGPHQHDLGHIAMTYTALALLDMCGDDLRRLHRKPILALVKALQQPDGSYRCHVGACESDMRFLFCAAAVCYMLDDWSALDVDGAVAFILRCKNADHGIGMNPAQESHGGSTYCAVAALSLMGKLDALGDVSGLVRWLVARQVPDSGFQGRPEKPPDTCYSFWVQATLHILGKGDYVGGAPSIKFAVSCQSYGFGKTPTDKPDPLHSYLGLAGCALSGAPGLSPLDPHLGFPRKK